MGDSNSKYLEDESNILNCNVCDERIKHRHPNSKCFQTYICIVNRRNLKYSHIRCVNKLINCTNCGQQTMLEKTNSKICLSCETIA